MGSVTSKAARTSRQYPTRPPPTGSVAKPTPGPTRPAPIRPAPAHPAAPGPSEGQSHGQPASGVGQSVDLDARNPSLDARLRSVGAVQLNPTAATSSPALLQGEHAHKHEPREPPSFAHSPVIAMLAARERIADDAASEIEAGGDKDGRRQFLDVHTIRQILMLRDDRGLSTKEIEDQLRLKPGVVDRLGEKGVVSVI